MVSLSIPYGISHAAFCDEAPAGIAKGVFPKPLPRRLSAMSKMCLYCVTQLVQQYGEQVLQLPLVYASRYGELERTHALFEEWRDYGEMSPAGFSLSVHNATASLIGLASHNQNNSTTLSAGPDTLTMGIIEAALLCRDGSDCLLVYGDIYPTPSAAALVITQGKTSPLPRNLSELRNTWQQSFPE